jgi:hypothetical protein
MQWPWPPPRRGDVLGILLVLLFVAIGAIAFIAKPFPLGSFGFGREWDCVYSPKTEPICMKRVPPK